MQKAARIGNGRLCGIGLTRFDLQPIMPPSPLGQETGKSLRTFVDAALAPNECDKRLSSWLVLHRISHTRDHLDRVHYDDRYSGMGLFGLGPARSWRSASDGHAALLVNDQRQAAIELAI